MKEDLLEHLRAAVHSLVEGSGEGDTPAFALDVPRSPDHGDFACNAAMVLTKRLRRPPREIAQQLIDALGDAGGLVERAEIAGPGFVNLWLAKSRWQGVNHDGFVRRAHTLDVPVYLTTEEEWGRKKATIDAWLKS